MTVLVDSQVSDRCPWATCFVILQLKPDDTEPVQDDIEFGPDATIDLDVSYCVTLT